jgi:hypothetical protein
MNYFASRRFQTCRKSPAAWCIRPAAEVIFAILQEFTCKKYSQKITEKSKKNKIKNK